MWVWWEDNNKRDVEVGSVIKLEKNKKGGGGGVSSRTQTVRNVKGGETDVTQMAGAEREVEGGRGWGACRWGNSISGTVVNTIIKPRTI